LRAEYLETLPEAGADPLYDISVTDSKRAYRIGLAKRRSFA